MSLSLQQIDSGIDMLVENAAQLIKESEALLKLGGHARAFVLAHLAREELSKALMLQATGLRILAKREVDWKKLMRRLRDHKAKLRLEIVENIMLLKGCGDVVEPEKTISSAGIAAATEYRNNLKNTAMYVGFSEGKFKSPSAEINAHEARRTVTLAGMRLQEVQFQCLQSPRLSQRKIGSLTHFPDVDAIVKNMDDETFSALAKMYSELLELAHSNEKNKR